MLKGWFYIVRVLCHNISHAIFIHVLLQLRNLYALSLTVLAQLSYGIGGEFGRLGFCQIQQRTEMAQGWVLQDFDHRHWLPGCSVKTCTSCLSDLGRMGSM